MISTQSDFAGRHFCRELSYMVLLARLLPFTTAWRPVKMPLYCFSIIFNTVL